MFSRRCSGGPAPTIRFPFTPVVDPPPVSLCNSKCDRIPPISVVWRRSPLSGSLRMEPGILRPSLQRSPSSAIVIPLSAGAMLLHQHRHGHNFTSRAVPTQSSEDVVVDVTKPFLSFSNHVASAVRDDPNKVDVDSCSDQQRRQSGGETLLPYSGGCASQAHRPADTPLLTQFGLKMLECLGTAYKWIARFLALGCYSMLIMPGFVQVACYYYFSRDVRRDIVYGDRPRNKLDLYIPKIKDGLKPVVAFVTGGAWIIGYKAWGSLLGQQLSDNGILVACIDYRNYPKGTISAMVEDASNGIAFICKNISEFGGDPNRIYLMGQSAGAHIASCALVEQAIKEAGEGDDIKWSVSQIKSYFGLSGGYNLFSLMDHFNNRGLCRSLFLRIMEGEESLRRFSPEVVLQDPNIKNAVALLPPFVLFHGTGDYSIPSESSKSFAETLNGLGGKAEAILYEGKSHTDVFVQDPMRGGLDEIYVDLVTAIHSDGSEGEGSGRKFTVPYRRRLVPELMLKLASYVSPF